LKRSIIIIGCAIAQLASPAGLALTPAHASKVKMPNGAVRHTWFMIDARTATCISSGQTPEAFQADEGGPQGRLEGVTAETIAPSDVSKGADGEIHVRIRGTYNGQAVSWAFYTSRAACDIAAQVMNPQQDPSGDIN
jgi:hypothetical protein